MSSVFNQFVHLIEKVDDSEEHRPPQEVKDSQKSGSPTKEPSPPHSPAKASEVAPQQVQPLSADSLKSFVPATERGGGRCAFHSRYY